MEQQELTQILNEWAHENHIDVNNIVPIPKTELVIGETYNGSCRNATKAIWKGNKFEYTRYKFGDTFPETINHYEDDNGYDLFVPIKIINSYN